MTGCFVTGYIFSLTLYPLALYMMIAAIVSLVAYIVGVVFSVFSFDDAANFAETASIMQIVSMVLTMVAALGGAIIFVAQLNWLTFFLFLLPNLILGLGCVLGLIFAVWGITNDLASVGFSYYVENGVSEDFYENGFAAELSLATGL